MIDDQGQQGDEEAGWQEEGTEDRGDNVISLEPTSAVSVHDREEQDIYRQATALFPTEKYQTDRRGGVDITYLEGETITTRLNETFLYGWAFEVVADGINEDADECWAHGRLTVWRRATTRSYTVTESDGKSTTSTTFTETLTPIHRDQYGSQKIKRSRSSGKPLDIGFDMKGAATDALKKCASLMGVGLHLWSKADRAMIEAMMKEDRENGGEGGQGENGGRKFPRPNRPAPLGPGGQGKRPMKINGIEMPDGFVPPFALVMSKPGQNDCRAKDCDLSINPEEMYRIGAEDKPGAYVLRRSKEEAGCPLCVTHTAQWIKTKNDAAAKAAQNAA